MRHFAFGYRIFPLSLVLLNSLFFPVKNCVALVHWLLLQKWFPVSPDGGENPFCFLKRKDCNVQQENGLQSNKNFSLQKMECIKKEPLKLKFQRLRYEVLNWVYAFCALNS